MKSLSGTLERLSLNMQHAFNGRIAPANRPGVSARRATLARLGLERLETRDLMSGMTLANPVSNVAPPSCRRYRPSFTIRPSSQPPSRPLRSISPGAIQLLAPSR